MRRSGNNDFKAQWNGQTLLSLTNAAQSGYTEYTYTVTATGSTSTLQFSAANGPSQWDLDNISLTTNGASAPTVSSVVASGSGISSGAGDLGAGKVVTLTREPERGGDGCGRHADADAQRRRHCDLYGRLRLAAR